MPATRSPRARAGKPSAPAAAEAFAAALDALLPSFPFGMAVSGGPDSVLLMHLGAAYAKARGQRAPLVFTVDHRLRPASSGEAAMVDIAAQALSLRHETLVWKGAKPAHGLQEAARAARYRLLNAAARRHGLVDMLLGHTADDQAETFLMRLARGAGVDGLAAMQASVRLDGLAPDIRLLRPLLGVSRARVLADLEAMGVSFVQDPSNADPRFERVRMRALLEAMAEAGISATAIARSAGRLSRARAALEAATQVLGAAAAQVSPLGSVALDIAPFAAAREELRVRLLQWILKTVSGGGDACDDADLAHLAERLCAPGFKGATLGGTRLLPKRQGGLMLFLREGAAIAPAAAPLRPGTPLLWDGRFLLTLSASARGRLPPGGLFVRALRRDGSRAALTMLKDQGIRIPAMPASLRETLPGLWLADGTLAGAPHLGFWHPLHLSLARRFGCDFQPRSLAKNPS
ncbi:MAG: tRNA lysidine(34) synthetase TilS [Alphaproteobacteria bacterium]|nr:tRNA lysidine(34) synthetase TilS [Alphaproteobacteria bacterium]